MALRGVCCQAKVDVDLRPNFRKHFSVELGTPLELPSPDMGCVPKSLVDAGETLKGYLERERADGKPVAELAISSTC